MSEESSFVSKEDEEGGSITLGVAATCASMSSEEVEKLRLKVDERGRF